MADHIQTLSLILNLIRNGQGVTRPELMRRTDLGRTVIVQRVEDAIAAGIVREQEIGVSTGGRPSKVLTLATDRGTILAVVFGATRLHIALADLSGHIFVDHDQEWDITAGPMVSLNRATQIAEQLLTEHSTPPLWAIAIGLPGPVDFAAGSPITQPLMEGWNGFPVQAKLQSHFGVPAWVENDTNLMALGTWTETRAAAGDNLIFIKAGTGIRAGLISRGRLHRGARGGAGDFGHVVMADESGTRCRCGKFGCLEAFAGGWALVRDAREAATAGKSPYLEARREHDQSLGIEDIIIGSLQDDAVCRELVVRAGRFIGAHLATLVSLFNPSTVFIGGSLARAGAPFLDAISEAVHRRSLPLATQNLVISRVPLDHHAGVIGAAQLALDELFSVRVLGGWLHRGNPRTLRAHADEFTEPLELTSRAETIASSAGDDTGRQPLRL